MHAGEGGLSRPEHIELVYRFTTTLVELAVDRRPTLRQVLHLDVEPTPA